MEEDELYQVVAVLEALKQASHNLQKQPNNEQSVKALLELQTEDLPTKFRDPNLKNLSKHLSNLKFELENIGQSRGFLSFFRRMFFPSEISRVACSIESEIQAWIDRENIENLLKALKSEQSNAEQEQVRLLTAFESRVSVGFNRDLQDSILRSKIICVLELVLCDTKKCKRIREHSAAVMAALFQFNKDVFVGQVLMGPIIHSLVSMASLSSIQVICILIRAIKSAFVDEIQSNGVIQKIMGFLDSEEKMRVLAYDCVLEIGYFGRKEAIETILEEGLVRKLVELERSEAGGDLIELQNFHESDGNSRERGLAGGGVSTSLDIESPKSEERRYMEKHPFTSCVARFAIQLEVGQGLREREKRAFKLEILKRVKEAIDSDAEAAAIILEVLWGASP